MEFRMVIIVSTILCKIWTDFTVIQIQLKRKGCFIQTIDLSNIKIVDKSSLKEQVIHVYGHPWA